MSSSLNKTVDTLVQSFQEYKAQNEHRMKGMENMHLVANRPELESIALKSETDMEYKQSFIQYVRSGNENAINSFDKKSLSTGVDSDGGYLIPQIIKDNIHSTIEVLSPIRKLSNVMQISTSSVDILLNKKDLDVGWSAETANRDETSSPELCKKVITAHEIYAKPKATQKLLDDAAINVEEWIASEVSSKMAEIENSAFLNGDGNNKPKGILSYDTADEPEVGKLLHVSYDSASDSLSDKLIEMSVNIKSEYLHNTNWLMSRGTLAKIRKLKDKDGRYLWQPSLSLGSPSTILGYNVEICDEMPSLDDSDNLSILFGNFTKAYQIVDRQGIHVLRDPYSSKPYVEFYTTKRVGGDMINFDALTVLKVA